MYRLDRLGSEKANKYATLHSRLVPKKDQPQRVSLPEHARTSKFSHNAPQSPTGSAVRARVSKVTVLALGLSRSPRALFYLARANAQPTLEVKT